MILSVSRRTDIPAFFGGWFINRIKAGYLMVRNPYDKKKIWRISLDPKKVDLLVFWSKNPKDFLQYLDLLKDYNYYFQFTLTSYDQNVEKGLPQKKHLIQTFIDLSNKIGKNRVIWRYDPIISSKKYNCDYHIKYFSKLCEKLSPYCEQVVISFTDFYKRTEVNTKEIDLIKLNLKDKQKLALELKIIAEEYGLKLKICSQDIGLNKEIEKSRCIDPQLIKEIFNLSLDLPFDKYQRDGCGCLKSIDVGEYNSCPNHCLYCYANYDYHSMMINYKNHKPHSPLLIGNIEDGDEIIEKEIFSNKTLTLF